MRLAYWATSAAADAACLGCGNATRTVVRSCIGRLSVVAGTAHARWCSPFAAVCWAEVLPVTATDAGRALGPMLPSSARERWPFCVLRDSCHAALPDQPGSPAIGSGRQTGGSRHRQSLRNSLLLDVVPDEFGHGSCGYAQARSEAEEANRSWKDSAGPRDRQARVWRRDSIQRKALQSLAFDLRSRLLCYWHTLCLHSVSPGKKPVAPGARRPNCAKLQTTRP